MSRHVARPESIPSGAVGETLCAECGRRIHAQWVYVGLDRQPDLRWRHSPRRLIGVRGG